MEHLGLAILVPVLRRPHRVAPLLDSIRATTPEPYRVVFICDPDDEPEQAAVRDAGGEFFVTVGGYQKKINAAVRGTQEPLLLLGADDLLFHPGWFEAATEKFTDGIGVVGLNDLTNPRVIRGEHATHFLVTREYANRGTIDNRPGVLFEGYHHWNCDDELVATAKFRGMYAHAFDSHVEHLHPFGGKAPMDDTYRLGMSRKRLDRKTFNRRERLWR